ncbi:hypothetical protein QAD02_018026 [Eretmocerus hayati]|uniref:Uncharacterized protein n=1 Tax=Eretmocerus hayati TaxID=131215 RepID=A0ACC2PI13_9HYME|nr:hypothetical protein QAD02_018026 [Eretmocerus hayati]
MPSHQNVFECEYCDKRFRCKEITEKHETQHSASRTFSCKFCQKTFAYKSSWKSHSRLHTGEELFSCKVCGKNCTKASNLKVHMTTHSGERPFSCTLCPKKFSTKSYLDGHLRMHTGEKRFGCDYCGRRFVMKNVLLAHTRIHTGEYPFSCKICGIGSVSQSHLGAHMKIHASDKSFPCRVCERKFRTHNGLMRHEVTHTGDKSFLCDYCGKGFGTKNVLKSHIQRHMSDWRVSCKICGKGFISKGSLKQHMRSHLNRKPFSCDVCNKRYLTKELLTNHLEKWDNKKTCSCDICKKKFHRAYSLVNHMRTHTGEMPFSCTICNKKFRFQGGLCRHMKKTHKDGKPFLCQHCDREFYHKHKLTEHVKMHMIAEESCYKVHNDKNLAGIEGLKQIPSPCIRKLSLNEQVSDALKRKLKITLIRCEAPMDQKKSKKEGIASGMKSSSSSTHELRMKSAPEHENVSNESTVEDDVECRETQRPHHPEQKIENVPVNFLTTQLQQDSTSPVFPGYQSEDLVPKTEDVNDNDALKQKLRIVLIRCEAVPITKKKSDKTSVPGINSPSSSTSGSIAETEDLQTVDSVNLAEPKHEHLIIEDETVLEYDTMHEGLDQPQSPFEKSPTCLLTKQYLGTPISIDLPEDPKHEHVDIDEEITVDDDVEYEEAHQEPLQSEQKIDNASGNFLTTQLFQASISPPCPVHGWKNLARKAEKALIRDATKTSCALVLDDSKFHKQLEPLKKYEPLNIEFESILEKSPKFLKPEPVKEEIEDFI